MIKIHYIEHLLSGIQREANIREAVQGDCTCGWRESPYVRDYEIIVVNDGSSDATARVVQRLAKRTRTCALVNHERNAGLWRRHY